MKAAWYEKNGAPREALITGELPTPNPAEGEVRVKLVTSGVNPSDFKSMRGRPLMAPRIVPQSDGAGIIDMVGMGVPASRLGQRVWIWNGQFRRPMGTAAQYITLPSVQAVYLPDQCDFAAGACLGIPALTAFEAVRLLGDVKGKTILVIGAASSVGHYAAQFASHKGATVIGTVGSPRKADHARAAGVTATIDYKQESVEDAIRTLTDNQGVDGIIDMDFSTTVALMKEGVLKPHGKVVSYGSNSMDETPVPYRFMLMNSIQLLCFLVYDLPQDIRQQGLDGVNALITSGRIVHTIGAHMPLANIVQAYEAVEGGTFMGNLVLDISA